MIASVYSSSHQSSSLAKNALAVIAGSLFLAVMARLTVPLFFTPVPLSLTPLALSWMALALGSKRACLAVVLYLLYATCGLPVLASGANAAWWMGPTCGYLFGYVLVAYLMNKFIRPASLKWTFLGTLLMQLLLLVMGAIGLVPFVGIDHVFLLGVAPFIPSAVIVAFMTALVVRKKA